MLDALNGLRLCENAQCGKHQAQCDANERSKRRPVPFVVKITSDRNNYQTATCCADNQSAKIGRSGGTLLFHLWLSVFHARWQSARLMPRMSHDEQREQRVNRGPNSEA